MQKFNHIYIYILLSIFRINLSKASPLIGTDIEIAEPNDFNFVVSIGSKSQEVLGYPESAQFCAGALITKRHILTSAHCVDENIKDMMVILGAIDLNDGKRFSLESAVTFNQWNNIHGLTFSSSLHDVAILTLMECVKDIKPAKITKRDNEYFYGKMVTTAGWGESNDGEISRFLQTASFYIISHNDCVDNLRIATNKINATVSLRTLCTKSDSHSLIGNGDSGGPLFINGNEIIGINESIMPSRIKFPGVSPEMRFNTHIGVVYYRYFIESVTGKNFLDSCCII